MKTSVVRCALVLLSLTPAAALAGIVLPPKDSTAAFGREYGLGFSNGKLYLHTGDSIYVLRNDGAGGQVFDLQMTGLEDAFPGGRRSFEGTFATAPNGTALIAMGFSDGGVLIADLDAHTTRVVPDFDGDGDDTDNVFSAAGRDDGTFYATWASRAFFPVDATKAYKIDPVTLDTSLVKDVNPGDYSGGMAFDADGNLVVGTFVPGAFPDPVGTANYFRIAAADLDLPDPPTTFLGSGSSNGNARTAVDPRGNIYFNTSSGIGVLRAGQSTIENLFGDITDPDLYTTPTVTIEGLAYDPATDSLLFAQDLGGHFELIALGLPEPACLAALAVGFLVLAQPARRYPRVSP